MAFYALSQLFQWEVFRLAMSIASVTPFGWSRRDHLRSLATNAGIGRIFRCSMSFSSVESGDLKTSRCTSSVFTSLVAQFESLLGCSLPSDYATFLCTHEDRCLEPSLTFPVAGNATFGSPCTLDELLTVSDLLANDGSGRIGLSDLGLLCIGGDVLGLSLYMRVTDSEFGRILVAGPMSHDCVDVAATFADFIVMCEPSVDADL